MAVISDARWKAILWAQWRTLRNRFVRGKDRGSVILPGLLATLWYGFWIFIAFTAAAAAADPSAVVHLRTWLAFWLLSISAYWVLVPVLLVSAGASLDLARLAVYPVNPDQLFVVQVLLRMSTAVEPLLLTAGLGIGMTLNPALPWWSSATLIPLVSTNLLISAGIRDLSSRLLARKRVREIFVFAVVLCAAAPQALLMRGAGPEFGKHASDGFGWWWPWSAAAHLAGGGTEARSLVVLMVWPVIALFFARWQFRLTLGQDLSGASTRDSGYGVSTVLERVVGTVDRLLPASLGTLVAKELRTLSRSPRFRLLFSMGFSFGLLVWLPLAMQAGRSSPMRTNYLTVISAYALMLLGDILFWNIFGVDRAAAQTWFVTPVRLSSVLVAKNITAAIFVFVEVVMVALACLVLRMSVTLNDVADAFGVTAVLACMMVSLGNLISVRYPRPINPSQSWRSSSGRAQAFLFLLHPVLSLPVFLAYGARYAFQSDVAFWLVIATDLLLGGIVYSVCLETAARLAWTRREEIVESLSHTDSPLAG